MKMAHEQGNFASARAKAAAGCGDDRMFLLSGKVEMLYVTDGTINLLRGMQNKMAAAGINAALQGMSGSVANAAMVAMHDGESVRHFGCYLGEQLVIGTFESVGFEEGEVVNAVVTRLDDNVVFAHAVVRPSDGLLWMPFSISKGRWKIARWFFLACVWLWLFALLLFSMFYLFASWPGGYMSMLSTLGPAIVGVSLAIAGGACWSSLDDGKYAEQIMKILGFKHPSNVNLSPFSLARLRRGDSHQIYDLRKALMACGSLSGLATASAGGP
jgi:hypothetical protein